MSRESRKESRTVSLGQGARVPYAEPTTAAATAMGKANRRVDTKPELALRSALHRRGLRFRKDLAIRLPDHRPIHPDVVFTRRRVAVFIDGCFWHRCEQHCIIPKSNVGYWEPKLAGNVERDRFVNASLTEAGWTVIRIWEHEPLEEAAAHVQSVVHQSGQHSSAPGT